jgi:hypothetical protein
MDKPLPIVLIQDHIPDSDGDVRFLFKCDNHYYNGEKYVLLSGNCDFIDAIKNGDNTMMCRYFSTLGCGNEDCRQYILKCINKSSKRT